MSLPVTSIEKDSKGANACVARAPGHLCSNLHPQAQIPLPFSTFNALLFLFWWKDGNKQITREMTFNDYSQESHINVLCTTFLEK
jgi:hypothetical protein